MVNTTNDKPGYKRTKLGWIPEGWDRVKLSDIASIRKGKGVSKEEIDPNGNLECIRYGELYTIYNEIIDDVKSRTSINSEELVLSEANDIIIPSSGETAIDIAKASCVLRSGIALGGDLNIIKSKQDGVFLSYYLNTVKKVDIARIAQGNSVVHLYAKQLLGLSISLPPLPEQKKIAQILSTWDKAIAKLEQHIAEKEQLKKGLMQQLLTGKKRFPGFTEEWKEVKLGEVFSFLSTNSFSRNDMVYESNNDTVFNIHYGDIHAEYDELVLDMSLDYKVPILNDKVAKSRIGDLLQDGDLLIADASEDYEGVADCVELKNVNGKKVVAGLHVFALRDKKGLTAAGFRSYIIKSPAVRKSLKTIATGSKVYGISKGNIVSVSMALPPVIEQKKIAKVLEAVDMEKRRLLFQLNELQLQKKALMQKLLTGEVRVKID